MRPVERRPVDQAEIGAVLGVNVATVSRQVAAVMRSVEAQVLADIQRECAERGDSAAETASLLQRYSEALREGHARRFEGVRLWMWLWPTCDQCRPHREPTGRRC